MFVIRERLYAHTVFPVGCDAGPELYIPEIMKPQQHHCGDIGSCRLY